MASHCHSASNRRSQSAVQRHEQERFTSGTIIIRRSETGAVVLSPAYGRTPMRLVWPVCFLMSPFLVTGCHSSGQYGHTSVIGTRHASYSNGVTDVVQLWRDGTYQQDVRDGTGKTISHMGQWHIDENEVPDGASPEVSERRRLAATGKWPLRRPMRSDKQGYGASSEVLTS